VLGTAFFLDGFEVQDAPRYGAERRGAPMVAYVRAAHKPIHERGIIRRPDLVVVADDTLVGEPTVGVGQGLDRHTVLLINSHEPAEVWEQRLNLAGRALILPIAETEARVARPGAACIGAAARMIGTIGRCSLEQAVRQEMASLGPAAVTQAVAQALAAYDRFGEHAGCVATGPEPSAAHYDRPAWIDLSLEDAGRSAPAIHRAQTSTDVKTGSWRVVRPIIDQARCNRCVWVCGSFCPDNAIIVGADGFPKVDYDHCKGCLICLVQCLTHAISAVPEHPVVPPLCALGTCGPCGEARND
jgi:pyruvate ferredoxin oxidoreductase gamma subunit